MFSLGWVVVSYFLICGGLLAAAGAYASLGARDAGAGYSAFFVGAAAGGFLAGRASPHRSYAEPALAAALVVVSILAFVHATPMGRMAMTFAKEQVWRQAGICAGLGFAGGFLGALVGEATQPRDPRALGLRWLVLAVFISAGALFASSTGAAIVLLNEAAEAALAQMWQGGIDPAKPLVTPERVTVAGAAAAAATAILGGFVTQLGAPRRMLLVSAGGTFVVMTGLVLASAAVLHRGRELAGSAFLFGAAAAAVSFIAALGAYLLFRNQKGAA